MEILQKKEILYVKDGTNTYAIVTVNINNDVIKYVNIKVGGYWRRANRAETLTILQRMQNEEK